MPEISVIVPVYNVEKYLRVCIDSILKQTFGDFELILIDDGSTDKCGLICDEYEQMDRRIRLIHQENGGLSAARNTGLDLMSGEYVTFIDSDDIVSEAYLEILYSGIKRYNAQISVTQMYEFQGTARSSKSIENSDIHNVWSGREAVLNMYMDKPGIGVNAWGKLYYKNLFSQLRFPIGKIHEDQAKVPILLYWAERVVINYEQTYGYRIREDSIMHKKFSIKRYDDLEAVDECISFFERKQETLLVNAAKCRRDKLMAIYSLNARKNGVYKEVPKKYRIGQYKALKYLYNHLTDDQYTYQLAKIYPNWILPHEYIRKIKKMLGIKVPQ